MKNMKIGKKLFIAFLVIIIGLASIATYGLFSIKTITQADKAMYHDDLMGVGVVGDITAAFYNLRLVALKTAYQNATSEGADLIAKSLSDADASMQKSFEDYEMTVIDQEDRNNLDTLKNDFNNYKTELSKLIDLLKSNQEDMQQLNDLVNQVGVVGTKVTDDINLMSEYNQGQGQVTMESNQNLGQTSTLLLIAIAAVAGMIAVFLAVTVTRGITRPVNKLVKAANELAIGNTEIELKINTKDEVGTLAESFEQMVVSIKKLIADANMLSNAAVAGQFNTRAQTEMHQGDYKKIVEGVNATLDTVVDKIFWFESLLDSIPLPIIVTNMESKITFANKTVGDIFGSDRETMLGIQFTGWTTDLEYTKKAGIPEDNAYAVSKKEYQVDEFEINNLRGEKDGVIILVQDVTAKFRSTAYSSNEVSKLANNLKLLKEGNLKLSFDVEEGDEYTRQEKTNFEEINRNFKEAVEEIARYIRELSYVLGKFAEGDLTEVITSEYRGDFISLKDSINRIVYELNNVFGEINKAAEQVAQGAQQVSAGNQAISQGAAEQASSIEELSSTVTHIAEQTHLNAKNSSQSSEMAMAAKLAASQGNERMHEMLKSMDDINESSENISKIIKVIDDIAFQTNILALNAAVEAARAGAHGKGFAVVAEEVRNLAARSAKAAKETAELIEGSMKNVGSGTKIANETAEALSLIVDSVDKAVQLGEMIAAASKEQSLGVNQVNQGIEQMSLVVQSNSATSQEGAASSQELSGQAELLKEKIGVFKLKKQLKEQHTSESTKIDADRRYHEEIKIIDNRMKY